jgi:hypothetical protein
MAKLHKFEGREVIGTKVAISRAGDGLSQALAIEPEELTIGRTVYVVLECTVGPVTMEPVKDTDSLTRKHKLIAGTATLVEKDLVGELLAAQRAKIEEAQGIQRLEFEGGADGEAGTDGD